MIIMHLTGDNQKKKKATLVATRRCVKRWRTLKIIEDIYLIKYFYTGQEYVVSSCLVSNY